MELRISSPKLSHSSHCVLNVVNSIYRELSELYFFFQFVLLIFNLLFSEKVLSDDFSANPNINKFAFPNRLMRKSGTTFKRKRVFSPIQKIYQPFTLFTLDLTSFIRTFCQQWQHYNLFGTDEFFTNPLTLVLGSFFLSTIRNMNTEEDNYLFFMLQKL